MPHHPRAPRTPHATRRRPARPLALGWRLLPGLACAALLPAAGAWAELSHPAALGALVLAGLGLGVAWMQRQLLRPLRQLAGQATRLAQGLDSPSPFPLRRDEFGQLGQALHQASWNHLGLRQDIGQECGALTRVGQQLVDAQHLLIRGLHHQQRLLREVGEPLPEAGALPAMQALLQSCDAHQASRRLLRLLQELALDLQARPPGTSPRADVAERARALVQLAEQASAALQRINQNLGQLRSDERQDRRLLLEQVHTQQVLQERLLESGLQALQALVQHAQLLEARGRPAPGVKPAAAPGLSVAECGA